MRRRRKLVLKPLLLISNNRKYIIKNHIYLEDKLMHFFLQSLMLRGKKSKAERLLVDTLKLLQYVKSPWRALHIASQNLAETVEISPIRTGKKVRMLPRASSAGRIYKRSPQLLARRMRARKFFGRPFLPKYSKEIIASLYFPMESERRLIHKLVFTAGYLNLRYLHRRWY